jgi:hypothetical protein
MEILKTNLLLVRRFLLGLGILDVILAITKWADILPNMDYMKT